MKFPFNDLPNTAAITCSHIIENNADILYVSHDADDGMWQFLCGGTHTMEQARVVSLNEIFMLDNSISEIANLPCGYIAQRTNKNEKWEIVKK